MRPINHPPEEIQAISKPKRPKSAARKKPLIAKKQPKSKKGTIEIPAKPEQVDHNFSSPTIRHEIQNYYQNLLESELPTLNRKQKSANKTGTKLMTNRTQTNRDGLNTHHISSRRSMISSYASQANKKSLNRAKASGMIDDVKSRDSLSVSQQLNIIQIILGSERQPLIADHAGLQYATSNNADRADKITTMSQNLIAGAELFSRHDDGRSQESLKNRPKTGVASNVNSRRTNNQSIMNFSQFFDITSRKSLPQKSSLTRISDQGKSPTNEHVRSGRKFAIRNF